MVRSTEAPLPSPVRRLRTADLGATGVREIRTVLEAAFGADEDERFTEDDWGHALGGWHFVLEAGGAIVAHAAVVERTIRVGTVPLRTGYVEAVAVRPDVQGRGHGTVLMADVGISIRDGFELGALGTGEHHFYERLGWRTWRGRSHVRVDGAIRPTPDDDGYIMVLETPTSPPLDLAAPITCEWRPGDVW
jgi:aminoglycoside 2'-N-acetyltransferase I